VDNDESGVPASENRGTSVREGVWMTLALNGRGSRVRGWSVDNSNVEAEQLHADEILTDV
jgi:hypothetical protein